MGGEGDIKVDKNGNYSKENILIFLVEVLILQSHSQIKEKQKDEYIANKEKLIEKLKEKGRKVEQR